LAWKMDMQMEQKWWTNSMDKQHRYSAWTCYMEMQHGLSAWTCSMADIQHEHATWKHGHEA
jgi:hypothetical protein